MEGGGKGNRIRRAAKRKEGDEMECVQLGVGRKEGGRRGIR